LFINSLQNNKLDRLGGRTVNVRALCAGDREFEFQAGQILHNVANDSPSLQHLSKYLCCLGAMSRRWAPQTRYTLRRNTVSLMKFRLGFRNFLTIEYGLMQHHIVALVTLLQVS